MTKIGRYRELMPLNSGLGIGYKLTEGYGMHGNTLFDQSIEKHASMSGLASVEPEREFVEISLQVFFFKRTLMRTHQPALNERCNAVYTWQNLVGLLAGTFDGRSMVKVFVFGSTGVGCKPVGVDGRAGLDMLLNKRLERFTFGVGNDLQPATSETLGGKQLHSDRHQHFASGSAPAFTVPHTTKDSFIHLYLSGQHIVPGIADCAPEPVQHRPSRLIGTKPEYPMQRFGRYTVFGGGKIPGCGKPYSKRCSGKVEDSASRGRYATYTPTDLLSCATPWCHCNQGK
jgi:hypothetical protein